MREQFLSFLCIFISEEFLILILYFQIWMSKKRKMRYSRQTETNIKQKNVIQGEFDIIYGSGENIKIMEITSSDVIYTYEPVGERK
jgi:hypothetical protein